MSNLTIVTAATKSYKDKLLRMIASIPKDIAVDVYDVGELGIGTPLKPGVRDFEQPGLMRCSFKPVAILNTMLSNVNRTEYIAWIDADCVFQCDSRSIHNVLDGTFDIAVTVKREHEIEDCAKKRPQFFATINAGVILLRWDNMSVVMRWMQAASFCGGYDQSSLSFILGNPVQRKGVVESPSGRVRCLSTDEWNCYYHKDKCVTSAKIIHYKGGKGDPLND